MNKRKNLSELPDDLMDHLKTSTPIKGKKKRAAEIDAYSYAIELNLAEEDRRFPLLTQRNPHQNRPFATDLAAQPSTSGPRRPANLPVSTPVADLAAQPSTSDPRRPANLPASTSDADLAAQPSTSGPRRTVTTSSSSAALLLRKCRLPTLSKGRRIDLLEGQIDSVDKEVKQLKKLLKEETVLNKQLRCQTAELRKRLNVLEVHAQRPAHQATRQESARQANPELVDQNGRVPLYPGSRTLISLSTINDLVQRNPSATRFAIGLLPYLFEFREVYKRTLSDFNGRRGRTRGLDDRKLNDLLNCTESRWAPNYCRETVRNGLSTHLWRLKALVQDLETGRELNDTLLTLRGLTRDHIGFCGFNEAREDQFRQLNTDLQALLDDRVLPLQKVEDFAISNLEDLSENGGYEEHPNGEQREHLGGGEKESANSDGKDEELLYGEREKHPDVGQDEHNSTDNEMSFRRENASMNDSAI